MIWCIGNLVKFHIKSLRLDLNAFFGWQKFVKFVSLKLLELDMTAIVSLCLALKVGWVLFIKESNYKIPFIKSLRLDLKLSFGVRNAVIKNICENLSVCEWRHWAETNFLRNRWKKAVLQIKCLLALIVFAGSIFFYTSEEIISSPADNCQQL